MPRAKVEAPVDGSLRQLWEKLLDPKRTSIKQFIEVYRVPSKDPSRFGGSTMVPFKERHAQTVRREEIERQWEMGRGALIIDGKPRQEGASTNAALLTWERFMRGGGGTANVFSYDDDAVKELFRLFKSFRKQTPEFVFTKLLRGGGKWIKSSAKQLELEFEDEEANSMIQCLTAGDQSSGSGSSPRWLLFDEFSKWKKEAKQDTTSMTEGWQNAPGNMFIIQATGQGNEEFAAMFMDAYEGRGSSGLKALFFPWLGHPDRTLPFKSEADRARFAEKVGKERGYGIKDETALLAAGATLEELLWRRQKVSGPGFKWNLDLFRREYPLTPNDMISSSTRTVFYGHDETLKSYQVPSAEKERAARTGALEIRGGVVVLDEYPGGAWTIFEDPSPDTYYCFGGDPTSGKMRTAQGNGEPDFAVGTFDEVWTGRTVARYRGHLEGRALGVELFKGAMLYKGKDGIGAWGFIENNTFGEAAIVRFKEQELGAVSGDDGLLLKHYTDPVNRGDSVAEVGFGTYGNSRETLIDMVRDWLEEIGPYRPGTVCMPDAQFIIEALVFERNPKTGKAEARRGHDDAVFAKALALYARFEIFRLGLVEASSRVTVKAPVQYDPIGEFFRRELEESLRRRVRGSNVLGKGF